MNYDLVFILAPPQGNEWVCENFALGFLAQKCLYLMQKCLLIILKPFKLLIPSLLFDSKKVCVSPQHVKSWCNKETSLWEQKFVF